MWSTEKQRGCRTDNQRVIRLIFLSFNSNEMLTKSGKSKDKTGGNLLAQSHYSENLL